MCFCVNGMGWGLQLLNAVLQFQPSLDRGHAQRGFSSVVHKRRLLLVKSLKFTCYHIHCRILELFLHFAGHRHIFLMAVLCHMKSVRRVVFTCTHLHYRKHSSHLFAKMLPLFFLFGKSCHQFFFQKQLLMKQKF